ncbi:MAG TPA: 2Fe-2S iron-sulfur cluster-binding protein [Phycisphaerae bacterium]|nr:2Fe-2S iron-sulfur cluster-binding protein [Phycisphaerae bacterium]
MGGQNPYLHEQEVELPRQGYTLIVIGEEGQEHSIAVDPARMPYGEHGRPGSILDICLGNGLELDHACGGVCACATCHVHVLEGAEACSESTEEEEDQLEEAYDLKPNSRLACQCVPNGSRTVKVRIPSWNRNLARESHSAETMKTKKDG